MTLACLAVIGSLCIAPATNRSEFKLIQNNTLLGGSILLSTEDWTLDQTAYSDCINCGPDKNLFNKICEEGECVSYFRQCDDVDHPTACSYYFDEYPPVEVRAKSESAFRDAVATIGLIQRSNPLKSVFPLAVFTKEGAGSRRFVPSNPLHTAKGDSK